MAANEIFQLINQYGTVAFAFLFYVDFRQILKKNTAAVESLKATVDKWK